MAGIMIPVNVFSQRISIEGFIISSGQGAGMEDVNIFDKISGTGTLSDKSGHFKLLLNPGKVQLSFQVNEYSSFSTGFEAKNDTIIKIHLEQKKELKTGVLEKYMPQLLTSKNDSGKPR